MSSYRPICDIWILGRPKVAYHGAYPNGFLERARPLVAHRGSPVLHVCGGKVKEYPAWAKLCRRDKTVDLDIDLQPDYLQDVREPLPVFEGSSNGLWPGMLIDRPYSETDADQYKPGREYLPGATALLRHCLKYVMVGGKVGMLDYKVPAPVKDAAKFMLVAGVFCGYNNNMRAFSMFERLK